MSYETLSQNSPEALSASPIPDNVEALAKLFPSAVQDRQVDFDALKTLLGEAIEEDDKERFGLHWHGKKEARRFAMEPSLGTLRPCREESVDWDTTKNLYIEGDNLEVLKLLRKSYSGKVKMIYIDPPYNTGKDFVYQDDYTNSLKAYKRLTGQGTLYPKNAEICGKYHTNWLNMIFPRLLVSFDLLMDEGLIFVSIDDNEFNNVKSIMDEIYGSPNFVSYFIWNKTSKAPTLSNKVRKKHEFILCYAKRKIDYLKGKDSYNIDAPLFNSGNEASDRILPSGSLLCNFSDGVYDAGKYGRGDKEVILYDKLYVKDNINVHDVRIHARFKWSQEKMNDYIEKGYQFTYKTSSMETMYYDLSYKEKQFLAPSDIINKIECGVETNDEAHDALTALFFGHDIFEYPKPVSLIKYLVSLIDKTDGIFLDFFSGSGTLAEAIFSSNITDKGKKRFICVQLPQQICEEKATSAKSKKIARNAISFLKSLGKAPNICEIGKERIRLAGKKIKDESGLVGHGLDIGFRVYKLDSSNVRVWNPEVNEEDLVEAMNRQAEHLVAGRTSEDFLTEIMLKCGIDLVEQIGEREIEGHKVQSLGYGQYYACMDNNIAKDVEGLAHGIVEWHAEETRQAGVDASDACTVFVLDQAFDGKDAAKMNFVAILEQYGIHNVKAF